MADKKFTQLTADTAPIGADIVAVSQSPFGAGSSKKVTVNDLFTAPATFVDDAAPVGADILPLIVNPGGTGTNRKVTVSNLATTINAAGYWQRSAGLISPTTGTDSELIGSEVTTPSVTVSSTTKGLTFFPILAGQVDPVTDTITINGHGYTNGLKVSLGIQYSGTIPGGTNAGTIYFIVNATLNTFQLSLTLGGAAIDITSAGTNTFGIVCAVDAATNIIYYHNHGLSNNDPIAFTTYGSIFGGIYSNQIYFVVNATSDSFQISTGSGGAAIDITTSGTHVFLITPLIFWTTPTALGNNDSCGGVARILYRVGVNGAAILRYGTADTTFHFGRYGGSWFAPGNYGNTTNIAGPAVKNDVGIMVGYDTTTNLGYIGTWTFASTSAATYTQSWKGHVSYKYLTST